MPLPSRAISHARGHLRVSRFAWQTTEKRETARSLPNGWLLNHVHLLLMNVFTHSNIFFAWIFPFFTNVCMIQWKSLSSLVKTLFSFYLLFLSKIYSFLFDWVCCWGRKNTNICCEIILPERCNLLSGCWVSTVYLVFFTFLFYAESWCVDHNACAMYGAEHCESYDWIDLNCPKLCGHCGKGEFATFQFSNFLIIVVFDKGAFSLQSSQFSLVLPVHRYFYGRLC